MEEALSHHRGQSSKAPAVVEKVKKMEAIWEILKDGLEEKKSRIQGAVETMRDDGKSDEQIVERLMFKYGLKKEEAEEHVLVLAGVWIEQNKGELFHCLSVSFDIFSFSELKRLICSAFRA